MLDTDHLHRITGDAEALAGAGVDGLDPESLCDVALTARRLRELADHLEAHALGALEPTGHTEATTGLSAAVWFAREAKLPSSAGRAQVTTARTLRHLPATDQAWLDGRLTREHVRVLTAAANPRIREHIATLETDLVAIAEDRTFHHWRLRVADVVARLDTEGPQPDDPNHTTASWGRSGLFAELRAKFAGADVELLEQIIEARTNALYRANIEEHKHSSDLPLLTRNQLRAHAIIDLILHGPDTDELDDTDTPDTPDTDEASTAPSTRPSKKTNRTQIGIMFVLRPGDTDELPHLDRSVSWSLTNPEGHHLALEHLSSLLCDCEANPLLVDDDGNPLVFGRSTRRATLKQRRAVIIRDGGCAMPGCDCPTAWVEIHHVKWWSKDGETDIANLVALCRRHHGITHRKGWTMHATADGWFWWTTPSGDTFWSQRHGRQRAGPTPPLSADIAA